MKAAEIAARIETRIVAGPVFGKGAWVEAVGSSGTARALGDICRQNGHSDGAITLDGLRWLRERLIKTGNVSQLELPGLKPDRRPVIAGGLAIMLAIFEELGVASMAVAQGAMREGILWDLLGRVHDRDMRDVTVSQFQRRYQVDMAQARRVESLALALFQTTKPSAPAMQRLAWAARLHEIGISIAHSGFHKHGAYILENADMPGFSRRDQAYIALLVRAVRGGLDKLGLSPAAADWPLILCLRLGVLFNMSRSDAVMPVMSLHCESGLFRLSLPAAWLKENPLTRAALDDEVGEWGKAAAGMSLELV
jgi:exopolyphosphatase/guanosine-5'-triphosphate,3'-diphosphate pyrophosphatase